MLPNATNVATTLATLVAPMIGPHGRDVLLETDDHTSALITGSGHVLLTNVLDVDASENKGNIVARYLLQQLNEHNDRHGDGCTTVILMVAAGLRRASLSNGRNVHSTRARRRMLRLARTLQWLRSSWIEREYGHAIISTWALPMLRSDVSSIVRALFVTSLAGQYGPSAVNVLSEMSSVWILGTTVKEAAVESKAATCKMSGRISVMESLSVIEERVDHILRDWPVIKASGGLLSSSQILLDEVLIGRPFFREQSWAKHHYQADSTEDSIKDGRITFVVVVASFEPSASSQLMSAPIAQTFLRDSHANDVVTSRSKWSGLCVDAIADAGVRLLLCTEALPEEFAGHLRRRNVLAVDHVEHAQAVLLCHRAGIAPLSYGAPSAFHEMDFSREMGRASAVGRVTLGQINCVYIRGLIVETGSPVPGQLLLQGPSDGLLRQYERSVRRMLIVAKRWFVEGRERKNDTLRVVLGGGQTEIAGQVWCQHLCDLFSTGRCPFFPHVHTSSTTERPTDAEIGLGFGVLAAMFGSVPLALAQRKQKGSSEYMKEVARMRAHVSSTCLSYDGSGNVVVTLCERLTRLDLVNDGQNSAAAAAPPPPPSPPPPPPPIETPEGRLANILKAVDIVLTLLRVDDVLRVRNKSTSVSRCRRRQVVTSSHSPHDDSDNSDDFSNASSDDDH